MVTILGIQFPTTGTVLKAPKSDVVLAYTKAMREGKGSAKRVLKHLDTSNRLTKKQA